MLIVNRCYTKTKYLKYLDFLFYLYSEDVPFKLCHHIIIMKEFLLESFAIIYTRVICYFVISVPSRKIF